MGKAAQTAEEQKQMQFVEASISRIPPPVDSERLRLYLSRNPCPTPPYYPQIPPPLSDTLEYFNRLLPETLFFIFYYMEVSLGHFMNLWAERTTVEMWFGIARGFREPKHSIWQRKR